MKKLFLILAILLVLGAGFSHAEEVSSTREDQKRIQKIDDIEKAIIRLEEGQKATNQRIDGLENSLNQRIDGLENSLNQRIGDIRDLLYVIIGGMIGLVGFVIWDRRTALQPAINKNRELEEREEKVEKILKEYAKAEPKLAEIIRSMKL